MRCLCILLGIASLLTLRAGAQQPQATPPPLAPGPLLSRAPAYSQWLVSIKYASGAPGASVSVPDAQTKYDQRTLVRKTGDIRYEVTVTADKQKTEKWCRGNVQATVIPGVADPEISQSGSRGRGNTGFADYSKTDFPGFDWISKGNYTGVQTIEGVPCIVFHTGSDSGSAPAASPAPAAGGGAAAIAIPSGGSTAYISDEGRLPVLLVTDNGVNFYQFEAAPTVPLVLPPKVQAAIDFLQARLQQAAAPAAVP